MLEKLLSLLIHAKAGAVSGVFLLGATGALVSVSATNGVTTITLTDPSPTPSASASPSASTSPTATPTATPTPSASTSPSASPSASPKPSSSPSSSACSDEAKANAMQVQRVDSAFKAVHADLEKMRDDKDRAAIEKADKTVKQIRQAAVKAIHETASATCKKHDDDDEDNDENDEEGDHDGEHSNKAPAASTAPSSAAPAVTITGDAKSIADQAITAMKAVLTNLPAKASAKPEQSRKPEASHAPKAVTGKDQKGEHKDGEHKD